MFNFFKKNNKNKTVELEPINEVVKLNLSKDESLNLLNLRKETLDEVCNNIPDFNNLRAKVALVLDFSGSMSRMFEDGTVQSLIEKIIPIALKFDDNGELDFWIFDDSYKRLAPITIDNFYGLAKRVKDKYRMGCTSYSPVMGDIIRKYTIEEPTNLPTYVVFITDGDNADKELTTKFIVNNCIKPIFWQCVGIGSGSMKYLEKIDDLPSREIDNVDFFKVEDPNKVTDESLYAKLFDEYPGWLKEVKSKGIID